MRKTVKFMIPAVAIIIFIAIMTSGGLLKRPFGKDDDVEKYIENLKIDIMNEKWNNTEADLSKLKEAWRIIEKRVQFSVERDEMLAIDTSIARIEGAVTVRDKAQAVTEVSELKQHWEDLEK